MPLHAANDNDKVKTASSKTKKRCIDTSQVFIASEPTTPVRPTYLTLLRAGCNIVARSQPEIAGIYSQLPRRIAGSLVVFPNPAKIPQLMEEFGAWLKAAPSNQTALPS